MAGIEFTVNGERRRFDGNPNTPLLWVLRDHLGLTGTKFGCGMGICGACTVHDGREAVRSCQTAASEAAGRSFTTIEGLGARGLNPCQRAWLEEDVSQCGWCQPGMIMTAAALLAKKARPSDEDIDGVVSEHICRCGTYNRIRRAIHRAAELAK
ncbi:MAG TPA: (2Fe-2S)-binding protein [Thermoanaerobaculia bacterium]|nr:(2Fe-2S)-binding protein [Thermoanaerobaculia bacterium]